MSRKMIFEFEGISLRRAIRFSCMVLGFVAIVCSMTVPASASTQVYNYDGLNRLTRIDYEDSGLSSDYTFDAAGNRLQLITAVTNLSGFQFGNSLYQGVIVGASGPSVSGLIKISTSPTGSFTGQLIFAGKTYAFKGKFQVTSQGNWTWSGTVVLPGLSTLYINLQTGAGGNLDEVIGSISDGVAFTASASLDRTVFNAKSSPALLAGRYTLLLPANPDAPGDNYPQGDGYATLVLTSDGNARIAGQLGDGTALSGGAMLAKDGSLQIFIPLYGGKGWVSGSVTFRAVDGVSDIDGSLDWFKPAVLSDAFYPAGFLTEIPFLGSSYVPPKAGARILNFPDTVENGILEIGEGEVPNPFSVPLTLDSNNKVQVGGTNAVMLRIASTTGLFTGSFVHPDTGKTDTYNGVVFQRQNLGSGVFRSKHHSGYVTLIANPAAYAAPTEPNTIIYEPAISTTLNSGTSNSSPTPSPSPSPAQMWTISASSSPPGGGTVTGTNTYADGATVSLTAIPAAGYGFAGWLESGTEVSTSGTYSFTADANRSLVANFTLVAVANGLNNPSLLAPASGNIYFTDNSATNGIVKSVPSSGGTVNTLVTGAGAYDSGPGSTYRGVSALSVISGNIFGAYGGYNDFSIFEAPITGGTFTTLFSDNSGDAFLAVTGSNIYYMSGFENINSLPIGGGTGTQLATGVWPRSCAFDSDAIYFVDYYTKDVKRFDLSTNAITTLIGSNSSEGTIFINDSMVFFNIGGSIEAVPKTGGTATTLVSSQTATGFVATSNYLFFIDNGAIQATPLAGGQPIVLRSVSPNVVTSMAVDNTYLYWTDTSAGIGAGVIMRTPLPGATLFADDFSTNAIDPTKWNTSGNIVIEANQQMQIYTNTTDGGGVLTSQPFQIPNRGIVTVTRRVFLHYGNDYVVQSFELDTGTFTMFRVKYANMIYNTPPEKACSGIYVCRNAGNPHDVNQQADISTPIPAIWDQWYDEKIVYEPNTGLVHYFINGTDEIDYNVGVLPANAGTSAQLTVNAWGWYTGHYQFFDDFVITQDASGP